MLDVNDLIGRVINADAIEIMRQIPNRSIDLIACDPPYGLNYNDGNDLAGQREKVFGGDLTRQGYNGIASDGEFESKELFRAMLTEAKRILKKGACCCCCGGGPKPLFAEWTLMMDEIIGFKQAVVWDKGGLGMGIHYRRNYEFVLVAQNGAPAHRWNGGNDTPNVWRIGKIIPRADQHPTQKPIMLMQKIIKTHSNEGDIVVEPFSGSGSTACACIRERRRFIAIELDKRFVEMSEKNIADEREKYEAFDAIEARHEQESFLDNK